MTEPWRNPRPAPELGEIQARLREKPQVGWLRAWWPAILWACVIFLMSTDTFSEKHTASFFEPVLRWLFPAITRAQFQIVHFFIRKTAHLSEYFMFALLLYRGIRGNGRGWRWTWGLAAFSIAAGYAALDEVHQLFVASRHSSPYDAMIDSSGALLAVCVIGFWHRNRAVQPVGALQP